MIPKEAIEKAIEGGWNGCTRGVPGAWVGARVPQIASYWHSIALDPTFWQALAKALGWVEAHKRFSEQQGETYNGRAIDFSGIWLQYARTFSDLVLASGDTKAFWDEVLQTHV